MSSVPYPVAANEPRLPIVARESFFFLPTAGMRLAPELLVLELLREVFFGRLFGETGKARDLDPYAWSPGEITTAERAVLHALRGRRKKTARSAEHAFYAPAYPMLASRGWFRKQEARVVKNFLFRGPLAQYFLEPAGSVRPIDAAQFGDVMVRALRGHKAALPGESREGKEILSVALLKADWSRSPDLDPHERVLSLIGMSGSTEDDGDDPMNVIDGIGEDPLASRITRDFLALCKLEERIPRLEWLGVLMTYLRVALPCWLLAHSRLVSLVREWLLLAIEGGELPSASDIQDKIRRRHEGLLHLRMQPTREAIEHLERYMRHRVELHVMFYSIMESMGLVGRLSGRKEVASEARRLTVLRRGGNGKNLPLEDFLARVREHRERLKHAPRYEEVAVGMPYEVFLAREGEHFAAWRAPLKKGQGKNLDEFLRVMYKDAGGDEAGGYLLEPTGKGATRGFRVFPGQALLKVFVYLAHVAKREENEGQLVVLGDVEEHFRQYGIEFSSVAEARDHLARGLQVLGLLRGSPDAGVSIPVANPYRAERRG